MTKRGEIHRPKHRWTAEQVAIVRRDFPHRSTIAIARELGLAAHVVRSKAAVLDLQKSDTFASSAESGRFVKGSTSGTEYRFKPGQASPMKGKRTGRVPPNAWKKGQMSHNYVPVGSIRYSHGYQQTKISETGYVPRDWRHTHLVLWEKHNGPLPDGFHVCFIDGNKANIDIGNLELRSCAEVMRRNSMLNLPPELVEIHRLRGQLTKAINRRVRHEKQNR